MLTCLLGRSRAEQNLAPANVASICNQSVAMHAAILAPCDVQDLGCREARLAAPGNSWRAARPKLVTEQLQEEVQLAPAGL